MASAACKLYQSQSLTRTHAAFSKHCHGWIHLTDELPCLQSWLCGKALELIEPQAVALNSSRGYETQSSKILMRWTVLASDLLGR